MSNSDYLGEETEGIGEVCTKTIRIEIGEFGGDTETIKLGADTIWADQVAPMSRRSNITYYNISANRDSDIWVGQITMMPKVYDANDPPPVSKP